MSYLLAIILGLVQGVTEFLPISSSGHLSVAQNLLNASDLAVVEEHLFFDTLLHLATLISICLVYWRDIADMVSEAIGFLKDSRHPRPRDTEPKPARRLVLMILVATIPLFVVLPLNEQIEKLYSSTLFIGIAFLLTGAMLFLSDRLPAGRNTEKNMTIGNALVIGGCQAIATLPGISRSGATITAGMASGLERGFAVKFSFLLSIPAVLGANILQLCDALEQGIDTSLLLPYLSGMAAAGVSGYFAIRLIRYISQKGKFGKFCYYCFLAGIVTIVLTLI
jgi:undecaprenyl-diphosphatase